MLIKINIIFYVVVLTTICPPRTVHCSIALFAFHKAHYVQNMEGNIIKLHHTAECLNKIKKKRYVQTKYNDCLWGMFTFKANRRCQAFQIDSFWPLDVSILSCVSIAERGGEGRDSWNVPVAPWGKRHSGTLQAVLCKLWTYHTMKAIAQFK